MKPGDKVQWTETTGSGRRSISMRLKTGTLERIEGKIAIVKLPGGHLKLVGAELLQPKGARSSITEFVELMRQADK